jgi:hypothetical protein
VQFSHENCGGQGGGKLTLPTRFRCKWSSADRALDLIHGKSHEASIRSEILQISVIGIVRLIENICLRYCGKSIELQ